MKPVGAPGRAGPRDLFEQRRLDYVDAFVKDMERPEVSARLSRDGFWRLISRAQAMYLAAQVRTPVPLPPEGRA